MLWWLIACGFACFWNAWRQDAANIRERDRLYGTIPAEEMRDLVLHHTLEREFAVLAAIANYIGAAVLIGVNGLHLPDWVWKMLGG